MMKRIGCSASFGCWAGAAGAFGWVGGRSALGGTGAAGAGAGVGSAGVCGLAGTVGRSTMGIPKGMAPCRRRQMRSPATAAMISATRETKAPSQGNQSCQELPLLSVSICAFGWSVGTDSAGNASICGAAASSVVAGASGVSGSMSSAVAVALGTGCGLAGAADGVDVGVGVALAASVGLASGEAVTVGSGVGAAVGTGLGAADGLDVVTGRGGATPSMTGPSAEGSFPGGSWKSVTLACAGIKGAADRAKLPRVSPSMRYGFKEFAALINPVSGPVPTARTGSSRAKGRAR